MPMIGVDEVGRGAWAGPLLVVAARLKRSKTLPTGLNDSKMLSKRQREALLPSILDSCEIGQGWVSADVIDEIGLGAALKSACMLAILQLSPKKSELITIDGTVNFLRDTEHARVRTQPKADQDIPLVSAASVVAKVLRDDFMSESALVFPQYGFEKHVGYGTQMHRQAIISHGLTPLHRKSFRPCREMDAQ